MANKIPVKAIPGGGSATALGEFEPGDVVDPAFLPGGVLDDSIADIEEEGVSTGGGPYNIINFVGIATAADAGGGKATVTIPDTNVDTLALTDVLEEGGSLGGPFFALDFVGIGTAVNSGGGLCTITIPDTNTDTAITDVEEEGVTTGGGPYTVINFIGAGVTAVDGGGGQVDVTIGGAQSLQAGVVFPGQWGYMSAGGKGDKMKGDGLLTDVEAVDTAAALQVLPTGLAFRQDSGGKGAETITSRAKDNFYRFDHGLLMIQKFTFLETASFRSFCGMYDDAVAEPTDADNIGGQGIGIQFSTNRVDTNFQFVAHDGVVTQTLVDTTVLKDVLPHYVVVRENGATPGNYDIELRNSDFSVIQASHTFTAAQLGAATNPIKLGLQTQEDGGGIVQHDHYHGSIVMEGV